MIHSKIYLCTQVFVLIPSTGENNMKECQSDLSSNETGSVSETKKELYDRLKATMQKEVHEASIGGTRRGFLHALLAGGVAATGVAALAVVGSSPIAEAATCEKDYVYCKPNYSCGFFGVTCPEEYTTCKEKYSSCTESCEVSEQGCKPPCININVVQ